MNITDFLKGWGLTGNQTIREALRIFEPVYGKDKKPIFDFVKKNINVKLGDILIKDISDVYQKVNPAIPPVTITDLYVPPLEEYLTKDVTIVYHDNNCHIEKWPITFEIAVKNDNKNINITANKDLYKLWKPKNSTVEKPVYACLWVIFEYNGKKYAGCCEMIKQPNLNKAIGDIKGAKIERQPVKDWMPKKGDKIGIFITGMARGGKSNVPERSNCVWVTW